MTPYKWLFWTWDGEGEPRRVPASTYLDWLMTLPHGVRVVALTRINDDVRVSTVFVGVDHDRAGRLPILFETRVFGGKLDRAVQRYETAEQARRGHEEIVRQVKEKEASAHAGSGTRTRPPRGGERF